MSETDLRGESRPFQTLKRRLRRLPLRGGAIAALGGTAALLVPAALDATPEGVDVTPPAALLAGLALAGLLLDRWCWRHTRTAGLRERYRALGARMEVLDAHAAAVRRSEELHRTLTETFGDVVAHLEGEGLDGVVTTANPMYRRLFGHHTETLPPSLLARLHGNGGEARVETVQGPRTLHWAARPALDGEGRPITRFMARDVTEAAEARAALEEARDEARAAAATKSRMLATVSHEIRNPLNGLSGMAQLLAMADLPPRERAQADGILRASGALSRIIADLLDDARMETGKLDIECEPFDPRGLTEHACELMAPEALPKGVDLVARVSSRVPALVEGDETRVRQVVLNLVGNAIKFTAKGQVTVRLDMRDDGKGRGALVWSVEDTGPGLEPRDRERIFDIFAHADEGLARRLGGIGLGLAVSRQLAERMGGRLALDTEPGEGSTFSFRLPVEVGAETSRPLDAEVLLVTERKGLAAPLREQLGEWGAALTVMDADSARGLRWSGPVLLDEAAGIEMEGAVVLRRDPDRAEPDDGRRFLRLPWRRETLRRMLAPAAPAPALQPTLGDLRTPGEAERAEQAGRTQRGLDVLLAEDDPVTQLMTTAHLERAGHRVALAAEGGEAARLFREEGPFDVVLMDLNMGLGDPEAQMDGLAALRALRRIEGNRALASRPIYVVTGDARPVTAEAAREAGATAVFAKPLEMERLLDLLEGERAEA